MAATRFLVSGKVQGVWFRASAREVAVRRGLRGFAKNLADGSVEVMACGDALAIEQLAEWLEQGPLLANVTSVERHDAIEVDDAGHDFRVA